ncbi:MAG: hypothetical protein GYA21_00325 [Myxococcales bacterium]|nr:hypothetical protein [Myxococcales bacterium]
MKMIPMAPVFCGLLLNLAGPAAAQERTLEFHPLGLADISPQSALSLDANLGFGENFLAFVPNLRVGYAFSQNFSAGFDWGASIVDPDRGDTASFVSGFLLNFKGRHCQQGAFSICIGVDADIGINPYNVEDLDAEELAATVVGTAIPMYRWNLYMPESLVIDPVIALSASSDTFFGQVALGPSLLFPLAHTEGDTGRDVEAGLLWGFDVGLRPMPMLDAIFGVMGFSSLTFRDNDTLVALQLCARLNLRFTRPYFRLVIPIDDNYTDLLNVIMTLGIDITY